ncbi:hypothetical protein AGR4C_pa50044 [Agrobacterium tumefaciens str. Kerr 14]|uniref:Uncharacterized protein n=1 Tax=Agrobacterium tumefaciens str. Kerr 14 TaxID=1183424 RepID=A0A1S7SAV2_AGRTU|nr:hypothetical protein AGR4C_pa50044 [Agrobacterium tumefaciens str. Kerr 14]
MQRKSLASTYRDRFIPKQGIPAGTMQGTGAHVDISKTIANLTSVEWLDLRLHALGRWLAKHGKFGLPPLTHD